MNIDSHTATRHILALAKRMHVEVIEIDPDPDDSDALYDPSADIALTRLLPVDSMPEDLDNGPAGWSWAGHRAVVLEPGCTVASVTTAEPLGWVYLLHEVSHAVWTPPGERPDSGPANETEGQDQWEYAVVRTLFPRCFWRPHMDFLNMSSRRYGPMPELGRLTVVGLGYGDCRKTSGWRDGLRIAKASGALDVEGRPTWKAPDYKVVHDLSEEIARRPQRSTYSGGEPFYRDDRST